MRTVLYASLTANGSFGRADSERAIAPEVLADFAAHVQRSGNLIVGRRTFELMRATGGGRALAGADLIVLSSSDTMPGVHVARSPEDALGLVEAMGHATALVGGGVTTDAAFLRAGVVDELRLNLLPLLSDDGPRLALADGHVIHGTLTDLTTLGTTTAQLHYELMRG